MERPTNPSFILRRLLRNNKWSVITLIEHMKEDFPNMGDLSVKGVQISEVLEGKRPITSGLSIQLGTVFGYNNEYFAEAQYKWDKYINWLNTNEDSDQMHNKPDALEECLDAVEPFDELDYRTTLPYRLGKIYKDFSELLMNENTTLKELTDLANEMDMEANIKLVRDE